MSNKQFVVIDPLSPYDKRSHHTSLYSYLDRLKGVFDFVILEPTFEHRGRKLRLANRVETMYFLMRFSWASCIKNRHRFKGKTLFFPHADYVTSSFFLIVRKMRLIESVFIFRNIGILDNSRLSSFSRILAKMLIRFCLRETDKISSETKVLQLETNIFLDHKVMVSHTPFPGFLACPESNFQSCRLTALFIGEPRADKGYSEIFQKAKAMQGIQFRIQIPSVQEHELKSILNSYTNLPNIKPIPRPRSDDEIFNEVMMADFVLLPYSPSEFRSRGSGILSAAILANKIVVSYPDNSFRKECEGFVDFIAWDEFTENMVSSFNTRTRPKNLYREYINNCWIGLLT